MAEAAIRASGAEREVADQSKNTQFAKIGFFKVFVFALTSISLTYSGLLPFSTIAGVAPGSDLLHIVIVAMVFTLINAYVYAVIGAAAPRYGADYYISSRIINGPLAFASSFLMVVFFALAAGTVIASIPATIIPMFSHIASILTPGMGNWDAMLGLSTPNNVVLIGTLGVLLIFGLAVLPPNWTHRFMIAAALLSVVIWVIICALMVSGDSQSFGDAWAQFMGQGSYLDHLYKARQLGMPNTVGLVPEILAGLTFGFWMFFGYFNATLFAKEVKKPEKNLLLGSWAAVLVAGLAFILSILLVSKIIPQAEWISAESYLYQDPRFTGLAMPWLVFYSAILHPNYFLGGLAAIAWGFGILMMGHTFVYAGSRVILAWANDHLLPEEAAVVHPVLRSPIITVLLVCIIAIVGVLDTALTGNRGVQSINPVLVMAISQVLPVVAILILPFRDRKWFNQSPAIVRLKLGPLPLVSLLALIVLACLVWMIVSVFIGAAPGGSWLDTIVILIPVFLLSLIWYFARRAYLRREGQDILTEHMLESEAGN